MEIIENGGILSPAGFRAGAARAGIKVAEELDVALLVSDEPAVAAGVFTTNKFAAAPVQWDRQILPCSDLRAVVVNSGNANACTGSRGLADARTSARAVADMVACRPEQVCVCSTGVIGHPLPMERLLKGIKAAHADLSSDSGAADRASRAIMTTDTRPKTSAVRGEIGGSAFTVGGMAKGAGMIAPNMATMLGFVATDAGVAPDVLQSIVREVADETFNRITIDGDTSTNDTVVVMANGAAGADACATPAGLGALRTALHTVMADLAVQIVSDGEGATRLVQIKVSGAADDGDAHRVARAVAESLLFKCAVYGGDPNWGRIVCALGYADGRVTPERTTIHIGDTCVLEQGEPTHRDAAAGMSSSPVVVRVDLGLGTGGATVWTCDMTHEYVTINADYHT